MPVDAYNEGHDQQDYMSDCWSKNLSRPFMSSCLITRRAGVVSRSLLSHISVLPNFKPRGLRSILPTSNHTSCVSVAQLHFNQACDNRTTVMPGRGRIS
jgi:hypothetical protein